MLEQESFLLKQSKCLFCQEQMEHLGHIISAKGVKSDQTKIQAMLQWPSPINIKEL